MIYELTFLGILRSRFFLPNLTATMPAMVRNSTPPQDPDQHPRGPLTLVGVVPAVVGAVTLEQRRDTAAVPTPKLLLALTWG